MSKDKNRKTPIRNLLKRIRIRRPQLSEAERVDLREALKAYAEEILVAVSDLQVTAEEMHRLAQTGFRIGLATAVDLFDED